MAIGAAFVPHLANTVLFEITRLQLGSKEQLGLLAVYREGDMTFDATARLEGTVGQRLDEMLHGFIGSRDCQDKVVAPLFAHVQSHFGRRPGSLPN